MGRAPLPISSTARRAEAAVASGLGFAALLLNRHNLVEMIEEQVEQRRIKVLGAAIPEKR
nr:hypothetical protein [Nitrospirota bacterium]